MVRPVNRTRTEVKEVGLKGEGGSIAILSAGLMLVMLFFIALAGDVLVYIHAKRKLQAFADESAAARAAERLERALLNLTDADKFWERSLAHERAKLGRHNLTYDGTLEESGWIFVRRSPFEPARAIPSTYTVRASHNLPLVFFGRIIGLRGVNLQVQSQAVIANQAGLFAFEVQLVR